MTTVTVTTHLTAPAGGWTADDLAAFPDDGLRHELVDGVLLVQEGTYRERAVVRGEERYETTQPFRVHIVPAELLV